MPDRTTLRFDSIEEAQQYVRLLREVVKETREMISSDMAEPVVDPPDRRHDALRIVVYKLEQLQQHLVSSGRLLNDLRTLRRALYGERQEESAVA